MSEHRWDVSINVTRTYQVQVTEAELVALMAETHCTIPASDIQPGRYHNSVIEAWTEEVCNELSTEALVKLTERRDAELTDEDADIDDVCVSDDTDEDEDEAWRPNPLLATAQKPQVTVAPLSVAEATGAEPVGGEWWKVATLTP